MKKTNRRETSNLNLFVAVVATIFTIVANDSIVADVIEWDSPVTIGGDSDVSLNGTLVAAFNCADGTQSLTVNGVTFESIGFGSSGPSVSNGNFLLSAGSGVVSGVDSAFGSAVDPFSSLSANYQNLLDSSLFTFVPDNPAPPMTLEISDLVIGQTYEFQWWVNDSRDTGDLDRTTTATAGNSVTLEHNVANFEGGMGNYVIGSFTADATTQQILFQGLGTGPNGGATQINAFQLRAIGVPEPTSISVLGIFVLLVMGHQCRRRC